MNDDELTAALKPILELDFRAVDAFDEPDEDGIAQFRRCGRRAARELGLKVVTRQTDPSRREDRKVVVVVAITNPPAEDRARLEERGRLLSSAASWNR